MPFTATAIASFVAWLDACYAYEPYSYCGDTGVVVVYSPFYGTADEMTVKELLENAADELKLFNKTADPFYSMLRSLAAAC